MASLICSSLKGIILLVHSMFGYTWKLICTCVIVSCLDVACSQIWTCLQVLNILLLDVASSIEPSFIIYCRYLNAIQTNAHHLLRYLATAAIVNKRRRNVLKELIKVIQQERYTYSDPVTEFLECLYVNYDFEGAQKKLRECEEVRPWDLVMYVTCALFKFWSSFYKSSSYKSFLWLVP